MHLSKLLTAMRFWVLQENVQTRMREVGQDDCIACRIAWGAEPRGTEARQGDCFKSLVGRVVDD
jgi:hypothetical protein